MFFREKSNYLIYIEQFLIMVDWFLITNLLSLWLISARYVDTFSRVSTIVGNEMLCDGGSAGDQHAWFVSGREHKIKRLLLSRDKEQPTISSPCLQIRSWYDKHSKIIVILDSCLGRGKFCNGDDKFAWFVSRSCVNSKTKSSSIWPWQNLRLQVTDNLSLLGYLQYQLRCQISQY